MATEEETDWQPVDQALLDEQYKEYVRTANRKFAVKAPQGRSVWRILPARKDRPASYNEQTFVHYVHFPVDSKTIVAVGECPVKTKKGAVCFPCQEAGRLRRWANEPGLSKEEAERRKDIAKNMAAGWTCYVAAVRLDVEDPMKEEPQVLQIGHTLFKELEAMRKETVGMGGDFTHPDTGFNIVITHTGSTQNDTEYHCVAAKSVSPILNRAWLKKIPDLKAVAGEFQNEQVAAAFSGQLPPSTDFPHGANLPAGAQAPALGPVPETSAAGEWVHPGKQKAQK